MKRIKIFVEDVCFLSVSADVADNYVNKDIIPILKEIIEVMEAPSLEDKEIF